ncbi:DNA cytosine methyltransferase [Candidatus Poseidonia alphae]|uniref:DNA cytosine methyltransferase n=1 Tax=Candidatus Poseidonia alphae TaxID=1915863 RepID=UPI0030C7673D
MPKLALDYGLVAVPTDRIDKRWLNAQNRGFSIHPRNGQILRSCDIFSGCGGITLGLHEAARASGFKLKVVMGCDLFPAAKKSFQANFKARHFLDKPIEEYVDGELGGEETPNEVKLKKRLKRIDIVVGGPPCQGNSNLNNHTRGDDPRNELYMRMIRFVELFRPSVVLIENVRGVANNKQRVVPRAKKYLADMGYSVDNGVVRGEQIGIPQTRVRHFTVAIKGSHPDFSFTAIAAPTHKQPRDLRWAIGDLNTKDSEDSIFYQTPNAGDVNQKRMDWFIGKDEYNLPNKHRPLCQQGDHTYPAVYGRMKWDDPAPTLTTGFGCNGRGRFTHPEGGRVLTPHEAARVQTFPDFYNFKVIEKRTDLHALIGNAVPPLMAKHILAKLLDWSSLQIDD